nr:hypothetical protein [Pelagimonas varians]
MAAARAKAAAAREQLGQGINPRDAAKPQVQAVTRKSLTIEQAMHTFITSHHATWSNAKHSAQWETSLTRHASVPMRRDVSGNGLNVSCAPQSREVTEMDRTPLGGATI